jgi:hypothetical protein
VTNKREIGIIDQAGRQAGRAGRHYMTTYSIDLHDIQLSLSDFQIMYVAWKRTTFLLRLLPVVATSGSLVQAIDLDCQGVHR